MVEMLESAYTFDVTFEEGPTEERFTKPSLLIGTRMLYQLQDSLTWASFCENPAYHVPPVCIIAVAHLKGRSTREICVFLCVDNLQSRFNRALDLLWHIYLQRQKLSRPTIQNKDLFKNVETMRWCKFWLMTWRIG
ncbi:hypothetical protein GQ600_15253 [Phytophthora cactorum]|nr:hypothetical protein GQ600_15253 [Phytophthora cactorum]